MAPIRPRIDELVLPETPTTYNRSIRIIMPKLRLTEAGMTGTAPTAGLCAEAQPCEPETVPELVKLREPAESCATRDKLLGDWLEELPVVSGEGKELPEEMAVDPETLDDVVPEEEGNEE